MKPLDEKIHNAEGLLYKFKFSQAQTEIDEAHELMDQYEENYKKVTADVEQIQSVHKQNDKLYEACKVDYREMKRDVLANRHQFGEAAELCRFVYVQIEFVQHQQLLFYNSLRIDPLTHALHQFLFELVKI